MAPMEVLPVEEVKKNPFAVLCTTSMGGHLSWFESGGRRWFAKPATNFLRKLAEDVDLDALRQRRSERIAATNPGSSTYDPMRRKLQLQS